MTSVSFVSLMKCSLINFSKTLTVFVLFSYSIKDGSSQSGNSSSDKKSRKRSDTSEESFSDSSPKKRFRAA